MQHRPISLQIIEEMEEEDMEEEEIMVEGEPTLVEAEDLVEEEVNHKYIAMVIMIHIRLVNAEPCIKIPQISLTKIGELQGEFNDRKAI
jgi:hypothetical protein